MNNDEKWMKIALSHAKEAMATGEVPVGAILVKNDILIASGYNQPIAKNDATAHAEIQLIRTAGLKLDNYRLPGTTIYVTLEPCKMCLGAILHARIKRVVYGAKDLKTEVCSSCAEINNTCSCNHKVEIMGGVLGQECSKMLQSFFKLKRKDKLV